MEPLSTALRRLIDDTGVHSRAAWAEILGVSSAAITYWIKGQNIPSPKNLRALLQVANDDRALVDAAKNIEALLDLPIRDVAPVAPRETGPTLRHHLLKLEYEAFLRVLKTLSPPEQQRILSGALLQCRRYRNCSLGPKASDGSTEALRVELLKDLPQEDQRIASVYEDVGSSWFFETSTLH